MTFIWDFLNETFQSFGVSLGMVIGISVVALAIFLFVTREIATWFLRTSHALEEISQVKQELKSLHKKIDLLQTNLTKPSKTTQEPDSNLIFRLKEEENKGPAFPLN